MGCIELYGTKLEKELRLLPRERRQEIVGRLKQDLLTQMEEQGEGEAQFCSSLPEPREMAAEFLADTELRPAGLAERVLALAMDLSLILAPLFILMMLINLFPGQEVLLGVAGVLLLLSLLGMLILYFPVLEGSWGQTVGKAIMGITVVREDGRPISYKQAFLRRLSFWFNLFIVDGLFALFLPRRQRAMDRVAGTVVAKNGRAKPLPATVIFVTIFAVLAVSILTFAEFAMPSWLSPEIPAVPAGYSDPAGVVNQLDLSAYGFSLTSTSSLDEQVQTLWQSQDGDLTLLAYCGDNGRGFLKAWSEPDRVKYFSFSHQWGDKTIKRYRTRDMIKTGWHQGNWAFAVQGSLEQFSPEEFKELIGDISEQLENME